ncbi:MAG: DUF2512 family protein [Bacillota bacterium]
MFLNFASRFIVCPLVVWIGQALGAVRFATGGQILTVGLMLAVLAIVMDLIILPLVGNGVATVVDFFAATAFIWIAGQFATGALVTFTGAAIVGALLAATEWAMHSWLGAVTADRRRRAG